MMRKMDKLKDNGNNTFRLMTKVTHIIAIIIKHC